MNSQTQASHAHTALNIMIIYQVAINLCLKIYFLSGYLFHSYTPRIETQKINIFVMPDRGDLLSRDRLLHGNTK